MVTRRHLLAATATLVPCMAIAANAPRLAVLDWGLAATILALGMVPTGVPAPIYYAGTIGAPALPAGVIDVGLLFTPNFEILQELAPEFILLPPGLAPALPQLQRIAPSLIVDLVGAGDKYDSAQRATTTLALALGNSGAGAALSDVTARSLAAAKDALQSCAGRAVLVASTIDDRHVLLYGQDSLFHAVLQRLGLRNQWCGRASSMPVSVGYLLNAPDTSVLLLDSQGTQGQFLRTSPFWQALPQVQKGLVHYLPPVWDAAGLPAASRFAALAATSLGGA